MPRIHLAGPEHAALAEGIARDLQRIRYLEPFAPALLDNLVKQCDLVEHVRGEVLAREGESAHGELFLLLNGILLVRSGMRLVSRLDRPGEIVGELAVLQSPPRTADVVVEAAARALSIRAEVLAQPQFDRLAASLYQALSYGLANWLRAMTLHVHDRLDRTPWEDNIDAATGLANRQRLSVVVETLAATRNGLPFSVAIAQVAPVGGPAELDAIALARFGGILRAHIRHGDVAACHDGPLFAIVLPNCDAANARNVVAALRTVIEREPFPAPTSAVKVSFGLATHRADESSTDFLARATAAGRAGPGATAVTPD